MRVAFITLEYPPFVIGGAGIYAANLTRQLAKLGHQVIVFAPKINKLEKEESHINNLEIRRIKVHKRLQFSPPQFWLHVPKAVKKAENESKFDIMHFNGTSYWFLKKRLSNAPNVITVHHLQKDAIRARACSASEIPTLVMPIIQKRCIKCADRIIAVSNFTKRQIIKTYSISPERIDVICNGVSLDDYSFTEKELEEAKKRLDLDEKPLLLFVGRVDDQRKGLDMLLKALKMVLEKIEATLLIVGGGDQRRARKLAQSLGIFENVVFTGFVDDLTLKKCYGLCDVYICPSRLEGFGLTILEAMAAGKPIVATKVGGIPEIIQNRGILIDSEDIDALSKAIVKFLNNGACNESRQTTLNQLEEFTWDCTAENTIKVYRKCLNQFNPVEPATSDAIGN